MRAAILRALNGPPAFDDFDEPVATPGTSLLTVTAAGVHHIDLARAAGVLGPPLLPSIVGTDGVGHTAEGRRVYFHNPVTPYGSWAERTLANDDDLIEPHEKVDDVTAAALGNSGLAAWLALTWRAELRPGERVLVLGATGTVGSVAAQAARALGASQVVATVRSGRQRDHMVPAGADVVVPYGVGDEANLPETLLEATAGAGFDVIIDPVWGPAAEAAIVAAARGARYVQIGNASGSIASVSAGLVRRARLNLLGFSVFDAPAADRRVAYRDLTAEAADGAISVATEALPLADVGEAWVRQQQGPGTKLVLVP